MSVLIDCILALILALCAFVGYKKGFVDALSKLISYLIAFTLANKLYLFAAKWIAELPMLRDMLTEDPFSEKLTFLDSFNLHFETIRENLFFVGGQAETEAAKALTDHAAAALIASTLGFLATFIVALLLLKLILMLLNSVITHIVVLKQVNGILGAIVGLLNGFFWTWVVTNVFMKFLLPMLTERFPGVFVAEIAESVIIQLCTRINPITYIIWFINFIFH